MFVAFFIAKSSSCAKNHKKEMLSLCFKARHPISIMKESHPHRFQVQRRREQCGCSLQSPPSCHPKTKGEATNTHTSIQNKPRGSERCEKDRTAIIEFCRLHSTLVVFCTIRQSVARRRAKEFKSPTHASRAVFEIEFLNHTDNHDRIFTPLSLQHVSFTTFARSSNNYNS